MFQLLIDTVCTLLRIVVDEVNCVLEWYISALGEATSDMFGGAPAWAKVGPYPVTVSDQQLVLGSAGTLRVAGGELYAAAQ